MGRRAGDAVGTAVAALFPHFCARCGVEGRTLCDECLPDVNASLRGVFCCPGCGDAAPGGRPCVRPRCATGPLGRVIAMGRYGDPVLRSLLHLYKYEGVLEAGDILDALFRRFLEQFSTALAVGPEAQCAAVPLHRIKKALRGHDQAERFGKSFGDVCGVPFVEGILQRSFGWTPQARITDREARRTNAAGAFEAAGALDGDWVLVDDVFTTGATMQDCAAALLRAGARSVTGVAVLRG